MSQHKVCCPVCHQRRAVVRRGDIWPLAGGQIVKVLTTARLARVKCEPCAVTFWVSLKERRARL